MEVHVGSTPRQRPIQFQVWLLPCRCLGLTRGIIPGDPPRLGLPGRVDSHEHAPRRRFLDSLGMGQLPLSSSVADMTMASKIEALLRTNVVLNRYQTDFSTRLAAVAMAASGALLYDPTTTAALSAIKEVRRTLAVMLVYRPDVLIAAEDMLPGSCLLLLAALFEAAAMPAMVRPGLPVRMLNAADCLASHGNDVLLPAEDWGFLHVIWNLMPQAAHYTATLPDHYTLAPEKGACCMHAHVAGSP